MCLSDSGGGGEQGGTCLPREQRNRWPLPRQTHTPTGPGYGCHSGVKGRGGRQIGGGTRASRDEWESRGEVGQREQGKGETGIWEVTVNTHARHNHHTINTVRHKHRRGARGRAKTKTQEKEGARGLGGRDRWDRTTVTGFPLSLQHQIQGPFN